jgi:hypothetical protein
MARKKYQRFELARQGDGDEGSSRNFDILAQRNDSGRCSINVRENACARK